MNKKQRVQTHKLAVLAHCMIDELDDMNVTGSVALNIREKAKEFAKSLEPLMESVFESKQLSSSVYLNEINFKIDTVLRKNYEQITE